MCLLRFCQIAFILLDWRRHDNYFTPESFFLKPLGTVSSYLYELWPYQNLSFCCVKKKFNSVLKPPKCTILAYFKNTWRQPNKMTSLSQQFISRISKSFRRLHQRLSTKSFIFANREETSLRHFAMVAKFLDDNKPTKSLKSLFALFQTSPILFSFI